jgi:NADH dehydrogenase (ubiquinone) Fe-S protein 2
LNHILAITTHALDVGALTPFLWGFEEREKLMEFYERVSGARLHSAYIRPGGVSYDLPLGLCNDILLFVRQAFFRFDEIQYLLSQNRIWLERLAYVGNASFFDIFNYAFTGVMLRGSGFTWDLRKRYEYESYKFLSFKIPVGYEGDCYDRFLIRSEEIMQSLQIIQNVLEILPEGLFCNADFKTFVSSRNLMKFDMETLIHHFKLYSEGFFVKNGLVYCNVEAPKGEFGVFLISNNTNLPARCRIRSPGFFHLQGLGFLVDKLLLSDVVTVIGSLDLVFGEIDR